VAGISRYALRIPGFSQKKSNFSYIAVLIKYIKDTPKKKKGLSV
jgi:hypothetical protein